MYVFPSNPNIHSLIFYKISFVCQVHKMFANKYESENTVGPIARRIADS